MDNELEVTTVKARQHYPRVLCAFLMVLTASALGAQRGRQTLRPGQTPGPRFLVPIFHTAPGAEKIVGIQAADVVRERMMDDFSASELVIVPKVDIETNLEQSGYSKTDALTFNDLRQLAPVLHAEEYMDGTIEPASGGGYTLHSAMYLVRPAGMVQPLPDVSGAKWPDIAKQISAEVEKARKQIQSTQDCLTNARAGKYQEARLSMERGVTAYPNAVFPRMCMLELTAQQKLGPDSIIKYAEEILKIAPANTRSLELVADAYNEKHMDEQYVATMQKILQADPGNTVLQSKVVEALVRMNKPEMARPIIDAAVKQNPGDPHLLFDRWVVLRQLKAWKDAAEVGEEIVRADTSMADTLFYSQLVGAYVSDSQPQKAAEAAARGANRHPKNATLWLSYSALAQQTGQLPQALEAINKVLEIDPKTKNANLQKANIFKEMNQPDSVVAAAKAAAGAGDDKATAAGMITQAGNSLFQELQKDSVKSLEKGERVKAVLSAADSLNSSDVTQFLLGATNVTLAQIHLQKASDEKSCSEVDVANNLLIDAQTQIQKGGRAFPQQAGSLMNSAMTLNGYIPRYKAGLKCK